MERHVPCRPALLPLSALVALSVPVCAPQAAHAEQPARLVQSRAFDLGAMAEQPMLNARTATRSQAIGAEGEALKPEKVKLRLTYQPDDEGPRFEIGTYGSRKGAMKSRLLHVAMDWAF